MAYVLRAKGNMFTLDLDHQIDPTSESSMQRVFTDDVKGIVVNVRQRHWVTFRVHDDRIWFLDSQGAPMHVTYEEYVDFLRNNGPAFVVRTNQDI